MEHKELCERVAELGAKVENLEMWQQKQNGSLQKIETKIERMYLAVIGVLGGMIVSLILELAK